MRWLAGLALLLLVCGAPGTAPAKSPAEARCGPSGARTVLITDEVRVAYKADNYSNVERVYGCWLGGRTQVVYDESCDDDTGCYGGPELWVAGRYVAYANFDCLRAQACGTVLGVRDLAARRSSQHAGPFSIWRLDIGSDGTLVWTRGADSTFQESKPPWRVEALRPSGEFVRLDESPDVDPASLAVSRTAAYWTRAGSPQVGSIAPADGGPVPQSHRVTWHAAEAAPVDKRPARGRCGPRSARTVFLDDDVRVTYRTDIDSEEDFVWGCWRGRREQLLFNELCDSHIGCSGPPGLEVQGRYVALLSTGCTSGAGGGTRVDLHDLARRRVKKGGGGHVGELGITTKGTVVYSAAGDSYCQPQPPWSVIAAPIASGSVTLGSGNDVHPGSLAVVGARAYWLRGGTPQSAQVP